MFRINTNTRFTTRIIILTRQLSKFYSIYLIYSNCPRYWKIMITRMIILSKLSGILCKLFTMVFEFLQYSYISVQNSDSLQPQLKTRARANTRKHQTRRNESARLNNFGGATRRRRRHDRDIDKVDDTPSGVNVVIARRVRLNSWTAPRPIRSAADRRRWCIPIRFCQGGENADRSRGEPTRDVARTTGNSLVPFILPVVQDLVGADQ